MLSVVGLFTLSSFGMKTYNFKKPDVELQTWYYTCGDGTGGSFLMPKGSTQAQALSVANALCN